MMRRLQPTALVSMLTGHAAISTMAKAEEITASTQAAASVATAQLPRDLSPLGMFQQADIVVQAVMIGLIVASIMTWAIWFSKTFELLVARRSLRRALVKIEGAQSLAEARDRLRDARGLAPALILSAQEELQQSAGLDGVGGTKERVASRLSRLEASSGRAMLRGTGVLATIGSTAPFVGLFGTVWGIMNSFIGISKAQTTNLAVVAPGIAEALLATALGLLAAIPAVVIYNHFARATSGYRALAADASAGVQRLVSRDLDRLRTISGRGAEP